jgi:hypothetical protein
MFVITLTTKVIGLQWWLAKIVWMLYAKTVLENWEKLPKEENFNINAIHADKSLIIQNLKDATHWSRL